MDQAEMKPPKPYSSFSLLAIVGVFSLLVLIHFGFSRTYLQYFPAFKPVVTPNGIFPFNWIMHLHGMIMMGWILMLLVQPILIRTGRTALHRRVGKLSYILAPLVVVGIFLANKDAYHNHLQVFPTKVSVAFISLTFPALVFFSILYFLAMYYRKTPALHMRYMCSTAFLFIPPALDRLLGTYFNLPGYDVGVYYQLSFIAAVVLYDSVKTKKLSPFALVLFFELTHFALWTLKETPFWQTVGGAIATLF